MATMMTWAALSKTVGWHERRIVYPTLEQVHAAGTAARLGDESAALLLVTWNRFLEAHAEGQLEVLLAVSNECAALRNFLESPSK